MNYSVMNYIDGILNRVTMYRLVLYYLLGLLGVAFVFGFFKVVPYDPTALAFSLVVILLVCAATNYVFAWVFKAASNVESIYITALILALIIEPVTAADHAGVGFLIFASVWASASKFIFAISKKHVFNPAAFAVVLTAFVIAQPATWWVGGSMPMMPFVLVGGLLLVRKIKRFDLVGSFVVVGVISTVVTARVGTDYVQLIIQTLTHSPMLFLGFVMLTEPLTTPPSAPQRVVYGAIVGFFASPFIHFGGFYFTPELALLVGNVFSFVVSPQGRHVLVLTAIEKKANDVFDFVFSFDRPFSFRPGQYMEWTLGHKFPDNRGNRRYFTIASAPTEPEVRLGVKFYTPSSTFKRALVLMKVGDTISASHIAGGFVLPSGSEKKLVFIAGGIGVTPFRSMVHYLLDTKDKRAITVFYANRTSADIAYKEIFDRAQIELGIRTVHVLSNEQKPPAGMVAGTIDANLIMREVPDYLERTFYISGPHGMVVGFTKTLTDMGVSRFKIKSDFFPGFV